MSFLCIGGQSQAVRCRLVGRADTVEFRPGVGPRGASHVQFRDSRSTRNIQNKKIRYDEKFCMRLIYHKLAR